MSCEEISQHCFITTFGLFMAHYLLCLKWLHKHCRNLKCFIRGFHHEWSILFSILRHAICSIFIVCCRLWSRFYERSSYRRCQPRLTFQLIKKTIWPLCPNCTPTCQNTWAHESTELCSLHLLINSLRKWEFVTLQPVNYTHQIRGPVHLNKPVSYTHLTLPTNREV